MSYKNTEASATQGIIQTSPFHCNQIWKNNYEMNKYSSIYILIKNWPLKEAQSGRLRTRIMTTYSKQQKFCFKK